MSPHALLGIVAALAMTTLAACPKPSCPKPTACPRPSPKICPKAPGAPPAATAAEAKRFMAKVNRRLMALWIQAERTHWVNSTHLSYDTNTLVAKADEAVMAYVAKAAKASRRFDKLTLPPALARQFKLLKLALSLPAPDNDKQRAELARIMSKLKSAYGKGKICGVDPYYGKKKRRKKAFDPKTCYGLGKASEIMANSRNYKQLLKVWNAWREVGKPMRSDYQRYVELGNLGAKSMGFRDLGALWRSNYDMTPAAFAKEVDRLWNQVKPLYRALHCHVRAKLRKTYGAKQVSAKGPIPAHLLGNMWAQDWVHIFDLVSKKGKGSVDLTAALKAKGLDEKGVVVIAEKFFSSLGLKRLPKTFWKRSMFTKPRDREVVCHASAWNVNWKNDLRIKMCIKVGHEDFVVVHHELGHNYYQRAYNHLPTLFQNSANDGFHEALGDTIALSVTPKYLKKIKLINKLPRASINPLLKRALDKVAFLPFGLLIDRWRWSVFSGQIKPADYNKAWWALRLKYQGIAPVGSRGADAFDPGGKYHVPGNVPYTRYFLAAILQFQFHRALCRVAGQKGPLHECSIYGSQAAGDKLKAMMQLGMARKWPEALKLLTGQSQMDATAMIDYFRPLMTWLQKQNKGRNCGW